jgi:HEPN domain-containing protein
MGTSKMFSRSDGYTERDLLQSATDHLASARRLFEGGPRCFDSAGYLSHLGIELILKAFLLHRNGEFPDEHSLKALARRLAPLVEPLHDDTITLLDRFNELRYPLPPQKRVENYGEIGDEDWGGVHVLMMELLTLLPSDLRRAYDEINDNEKSGRVLMQKPIGSYKSVKEKFDAIEKEAEEEFFKKTRGTSS